MYSPASGVSYVNATRATLTGFYVPLLPKPKGGGPPGAVSCPARYRRPLESGHQAGPKGCPDAVLLGETAAGGLGRPWRRFSGAGRGEPPDALAPPERRYGGSGGIGARGRGPLAAVGWKALLGRDKEPSYLQLSVQLCMHLSR